MITLKGDDIILRALEPEVLQQARDALHEQQSGSAQQTLALHAAEKWRDDLIETDDTLKDWLAQHPQTDAQQLRALIRQARKDGTLTADEISRGQAPRRGRAYREIFQLVREHMEQTEQMEPGHE